MTILRKKNEERENSLLMIWIVSIDEYNDG